MAKKDAGFGKWVFLIGILIAVIIGLISPGMDDGLWVWILIVLGLVIGFLNITEKESTPFLVATITLVITTGALSGLGEFLGGILTAILKYVTVLVAPAAIVVAFKQVWALASD
ncbi:hypothetical protein D6745_04005 [Candidatus Woesearchaeota archaeon]|nr:MAG: hypothetical protein D6745_04005 [Candidatus Woesearchaeota archaeon]